MIKTEDRLSRNLDDEDFTEAINEEICRLGASKVSEEMVISIAPRGYTEEICQEDGAVKQDIRRQ